MNHSQRQVFNTLADALPALAQAQEVLLLQLSGESSDFIRFNQNRVRQATHVQQLYAQVSVVSLKLGAQRRSSRKFALQGVVASDLDLMKSAISSARDALDSVPVDPYLLINQTPVNSERNDAGQLPDAATVMADVTALGAGHDLVGFYAGGPVVRAFANSLGQRNWHSVENFHFGWCLYQSADKAVQTAYAGTHWDRAALAASMQEAAHKKDLLKRPARTLKPGPVRAYVAPGAVAELTDMMYWGGLSEREYQSKESSLQRLWDGQAQLSPKFSLSNATTSGLAAAFQADGYVSESDLHLVKQGVGNARLTSPRTAQEFGLQHNGCSSAESPESLAVAAGTLADADVLKALDTGLLIGNLWYLNYSDRQNARVTGMTRFACFWVENGQIVEPVNVMRFDDSLLDLFGPQLDQLGQSVRWVPESSTYGERSTKSTRTPGLLLKQLTLTL